MSAQFPIDDRGTDSSETLSVSDDALVASDGVTVLYFRAGWCNSCTELDSVIDRLEDAHSELVVERVDVGANAAAMRTFGVSIVPTVLLFCDGDPVDVFVEGDRYPTLERAVERRL